MANLTVALRLLLLNGLRGPSQEAKRDLDGVRASAQRLNATRGGDALARDLGRVVTAGGRADASLRQLAANRGGLSATGAVAARLGADLTGVATAGGRVDAALRRAVGGGAGLSATGAVAARLGSNLTGVATAGSQADASIRKLGSERAGLAGLDAVTKALAQDLDRAGSGARKTAAGLDQLGSSRGRIAGVAAVAAELARNLERAASVVPRIRLPEKPVRPWGEPAAEPVRRGSERKPPPLLTPPPEAGRKGAAEAAGNGSTIVGIGSTALKAAGGVYVARTAIRSTVGEAISFEKAWAEVVKKVNDAPNPEAMQQLQRTVSRTAIDLGMSRNGLAELTAEAGAAGIKFADLERYVKLAAKASVGWDMTPREASQKLAEIKTAGQYTIAEMDVLADKINALGDNSAAKESDIVEMMQRAAAPAKAAGVDTDTSLAALTALRSGGMQAEIAARFFGAFTSKLATAEKDGKKGKGIQQAFEMIGLTVEKVTAGMKRDAGGTMIDILDRLAKHAEPAKVATKLMGQEWWDELARFSQSVPELKKQLEFLKNPTNFNGSLGGNLNVKLATTANHLERLKALSQDIGDRMGRWALPGINNAVQKTIALFDSLEQRQKLRDADKPEGEKGDPVGRVVTKAFEVGTPLAQKGLDLVYGAEPTADPARQVVERAAKVRADAEEAAQKARTEAGLLEAKAKTSKDKTVTGPLLDQARRARVRAAEEDARASGTTRSAGPAGARDMTDVEFGEVAARQSIETRRQIRQYEEALRGRTSNVRVPGTGIITSRQGAEAELASLRKRMDELTAGPDKVTTVRPPKFGLSGPTGQADMRIGRQPGAATSFPLSADLAAPKFDAQPIIAAVKQAEDATKGLQTTLKQDLSGPATESMETYKGALSTGVQAAVALVVAAAAQMKAALSFTATPTITPSISAPRAAPAASGGPAPAASPARASGGTGGGGAAPRLQSAGLRQRGGVQINGPVHVHGVRDVASLETGIRRAADRGARDTRDNGLHDLGATV